MTTPHTRIPPPRTSGAPPQPTATRLSQTVPQYFVRLAHEPSVGLHYLTSHAQSRAVPALAGIANTTAQRRGALSEVVLDIRDATNMIREHGEPASSALQRIHSSLQDTTKVLQEKNQAP